MKTTQQKFTADAARAFRQCRIFYFCGADEAGAYDAAAQIAAMLPEGSERIELSGADLRRDPARLADEARSTSLFGGERYIEVRTSGDECAEAVAGLVDSPVEPCPVLIIASSATDKSRIAKLLAGLDTALVAVFHPPDLGAVAAAVRRMGDAAGVRLDGPLAERIARSCALDTRMARSEIIKLALYLDASPSSPRTADLAALDAIAAHSEDDSFAPVVNCVLGGDVARLPAELARLHLMALNPVGLLLACERRAAQLGQLAAKLGGRNDIKQFLEGERVFFRDIPDLVQQLGVWRGQRLPRLVARLVSLHRALITRSQDAELLLSHGLSEIARAAAGFRTATLRRST